MDEWISTKDGLPKTEDYVLVWYHDRICTGYYHKPLPEPPKGKFK